MSPTASDTLVRPATTSADVGSMDKFEYLRYRVQAIANTAEFRRMQPEFITSWMNEFGGSSGYLPASRRSESWRQNTSLSKLRPEVLWEPYSIDTLTENADYLFEDAMPESVPLEWLAELNNFTAIEDDSLVLPWNEDPPRAPAGG